MAMNFQTKYRKHSCSWVFVVLISFFQKQWALKRPLFDRCFWWISCCLSFAFLFLDLQPNMMKQDKVLLVMPTLPRIVRHKAFSWKSNCKAKQCLGVLFWGVILRWSAGESLDVGDIKLKDKKVRMGMWEDSELAGTWKVSLEKTWKSFERHTSNINQLTRHQFLWLGSSTAFTKDWGTPEGCESLGSSVSCTVPQFWMKTGWGTTGERETPETSEVVGTGYGGSTYRKRPRYGTSMGHGNPISQPVCWYEMFLTMLGCQPEGLKLIRMDELRRSQNYFPTIVKYVWGMTVEITAAFVVIEIV